MLSTWACWEANQQPDGSFNQGNTFVQERKAFAGLAQRVFGDHSTDGSKCSGDVIFVGGFPFTPPKLGLDIVNPHHETNGDVKKNLTPNAFLCVEPGTKWHFAYFVRPGVEDTAKLLKATSNWLTQALTQLGIGAKTAAGYPGRFRPLTNATLQPRSRRPTRPRAAEAVEAAHAKVAEQVAKQQAPLKPHSNLIIQTRLPTKMQSCISPTLQANGAVSSGKLGGSKKRKMPLGWPGSERHRRPPLSQAPRTTLVSKMNLVSETFCFNS